MTTAVTVVFNPGSGQSDGSLQDEVVHELARLGEVHRIEPSSEGTFTEDVRAGTEGADLVVAAGGGGIAMWPCALPDDGHLDLCALSATSIPDAVRLGAKVKGGNHQDAEGTVMIRGPEFRVGADPPMEFNVDGELVGLRTPARFEILGRALFLSAE